MKILFINISDIKGGAAKSIWRIAQTLESIYNTENLFIVRSKFSKAKNVIGVRGNRLINILFNIVGLQYKFLPTSHKVIRIARKFKPDIISLNQIEGGYFQTRDLIKLSKIAPIFWTMHDEWAFNNNASSKALNKIESKIYPWIGIRWGNWLLNQKKKIFDKSRFQIIFPSNSLRDKNILNKASHIIPNGIDIDKFKPGKVSNLLFIAEKKSKAYKLDEILKQLDEIITYKIILTIIGEGLFLKRYKNILIDNKGFLDEDELLYYYHNADLLIYPSQADNCPLVVIEAMSCGLPVVAFEVG